MGVKLRRTVFYAEAQIDQKSDLWISDGVLEVAILPGYQNHSAANVHTVVSLSGTPISLKDDNVTSVLIDN